MIKSIIKEVIIFLLLLVSIALILGVLFYDYIPINKTVPSKVEPYKIPADIQNELNASAQEGQNIIKTLTIDSTELKQYEYTNQYDKGKTNPFAKYAQNSTVSGDVINTDNNTSTNTNTTTNDVGTFFNTTGK